MFNNTADKTVAVMNLPFNGDKKIIGRYPARIDGNSGERACQIPAKQLSSGGFYNFSNTPWDQIGIFRFWITGQDFRIGSRFGSETFYV